MVVPNPQANVLIGFGSARDKRYELTLKQIWFINLQWWIDTSEMFLFVLTFCLCFDYQEIKEKFVTMGNATVARVLGVRLVSLRFTSRNANSQGSTLCATCLGKFSY